MKDNPFLLISLALIVIGVGVMIWALLTAEDVDEYNPWDDRWEKPDKDE
jgi:hypothetical protein